MVYFQSITRLASLWEACIERKPILNLMMGLFEAAHRKAQHMKAMPNLKTDTKDAEWIGDLLQQVLFKASLVLFYSLFALLAILTFNSATPHIPSRFGLC